ncbi:2'-5' RNA ligase family protein [Streptomyces sp. NPDC020330]|uniref:2'-5' RNA ligase family protein n=1 Tax=unclassified Streptomyces TaxID=2593676 RepID=UPI00378F0C73
MESFFDRVGAVWPAGRRDLHWHILPTYDESSALVAPYVGFPRPGLPGVPVEGMHCTLLHAVGLARAGVDLDRLLEDVGTFARTVEPFVLTFDRPAIGNVAVELSGWPQDPFASIVDFLTGAMTRAGGVFKAAPSRYPHMSVAYTSDGAESLEAVGLKAELAAIEGPLSGTVFADRLHLVEQWHDGRRVIFEPVAAVQLGGVEI